MSRGSVPPAGPAAPPQALAALQDLRIRIADKIAPFTDPRTASRQFTAFRERIDRELDMGGASKCPRPTIETEDGRVVGYISYNGRVWGGTPDQWQDSRLVYCPASELVTA